MLGYHTKLRIGQNPGQFFEKLWAGKERKSTCPAGSKDAGRRPFPSYSGDHGVGIQDNFQDRRALRTASLTTSGFNPALATAE